MTLWLLHDQQTQALLNKFKNISLFSEHKAILIGGTALAYHLSHRESFDLDICFPFSNKLPELDFVINPSSNIYESEILKDDTKHTIEHLRIASIESIFKLKSLLLLDRNKIRDLYDMIYLMKECGYSGKKFIDTIIHYRITYLPKHIVQLIETKKEDPFDIEGIEKPTMNIVMYKKLKSYFLNEINNY